MTKDLKKRIFQNRERYAPFEWYNTIKYKMYYPLVIEDIVYPGMKVRDIKAVFNVSVMISESAITMLSGNPFYNIRIYHRLTDGGNVQPSVEWLRYNYYNRDDKLVAPDPQERYYDRICFNSPNIDRDLYIALYDEKTALCGRHLDIYNIYMRMCINDKLLNPSHWVNEEMDISDLWN